jgi:hypothetical protein
MKRLYEACSILAALSVWITACGTHGIPAQTERESMKKTLSYEIVLGKSVTDKAVVDFINTNNCLSANELQVCQEIGMAFRVDEGRIVSTVYLYSGNKEGFRRYRGELPFGLSFYDTMLRVQEKLVTQNAVGDADWTGLPDEGGSPDHMHYWAVYKRLSITIIYDTPFADEDAYIYAILINA